MTLRLPFLSATICAAEESPLSFERFCGAEKVTPESVDRTKKTSLGPLEECWKTTLMLPAKSMENDGLLEKNMVLERFCGAEKVVPPLEEREKKTSVLVAGG